MDEAYSYAWEFIVRAERLDEFRLHYGPGGSWERLFRQAPGYLETLLLQDREQPLRFVCIDRWRRLCDFEAFQQQLGAQYQALDQACEGLSERETEIGRFRG